MLQLSYEYLSHVSVSETPGCGSEVWLNVDNMLVKSGTLLQIHEPMSYILTAELNIEQTDFIAKWDEQICCAGFVITICLGFSSAPDLWG